MLLGTLAAGASAILSLGSLAIGDFTIVWLVNGAVGDSSTALSESLAIVDFTWSLTVLSVGRGSDMLLKV